MSKLRIWQILIGVAGLAVLFTAMKYDSTCTPIAPILIWSYVCGGLGMFAASVRGFRWRTGLLLGLLLGPVGVFLVVFGNPVPRGKIPS